MGERTFTFSTLLRAPRVVLPALDKGDVLLRRRGDSDLMLSTRARADGQHEALVLMSRMLMRLLAQDGRMAVRVLAQELPWLHWLPEPSRLLCVQEILRDLAAGAECDLPMRFLDSIEAWRTTAEAWSDPEFAREVQGLPASPRAGGGAGSGGDRHRGPVDQAHRIDTASL
jgi:hypothetical protein